MEGYKVEKVRDSAKVSSAEVRLPRGLEVDKDGHWWIRWYAWFSQGWTKVLKKQDTASLAFIHEVDGRASETDDILGGGIDCRCTMHWRDRPVQMTRILIKVDRYADNQERASTRYAEEARFASE